MEPIVIVLIVIFVIIILLRINFMRWKKSASRVMDVEYLERNLKDFELLETHGGHFMWVGEDMEKINDKRVEFLKSLNFK